MTPDITPGDKAWKELTPDEKLEKRLDAYRSTEGLEFVSNEAEKNYKERLNNIIDAVRLEKTPTRIPVMPTLGSFAEAYCGYQNRDIIYDANKAVEVMMRCTTEFDTDTRIGSGMYSGKVYDLVDFKLYTWPGHGLPDNADGIQYVEDEYMSVDEYDELIENPTEFWQRKYLPRVLGNLGGLAKLPYPLFGAGATAAIPSTLSAYGLAEVKEALERAAEAGEAMMEWQKIIGAAGKKLSELGYPAMGGGGARAPFDLIGDSLRGTKGIIMDTYRCPDKVLAAMDALVPIQIKIGVESARMGGFPQVAFALHKGADGFMSDEQFDTFYWPTLKKIALGLIEEGLIPRMGAQGGFNSRLEKINDMPKGKMIWNFGAETDMARAKEIVGGTACMSGNIPASMFMNASTAEVEDHVRKLIDVAGKNGGYILSTAAGVSRNGKEENVRAMIKAAKEYGVYS